MKIEPRLSLPESHQSPGRRPNSGRDEGQRATFWAADSAKSSPAANIGWFGHLFGRILSRFAVPANGFSRRIRLPFALRFSSPHMMTDRSAA